MASVRLSGPWRFATDPDDRGRSSGWSDQMADESIGAPVPGVIQQVAPDYHGVAWYWTTFTGPDRDEADRCFIDFGAVDYKATAWVDGQEIGSHEGGDSPFSLDASGAVRAGATHRLAVRVVNPTDAPIDGLVLVETPHRNKTIANFHSGQGYNYGGIMLPVEVRTVPAIRIEDIVVHGDPHTGAVSLRATIRNDHGSPRRARIHARVLSGPFDAVVDASDREHDLVGPESVVEAVLQVASPRLWDIADPYLYRAVVDLAVVGEPSDPGHIRVVRFGFRDFRIVDGFFELNGRRVFIRSTHTGNHYPVGQLVPTDPDFYRRDFVYAKAAGFNMIRFVAGMAWPEQLDFCDEIGLLVYEETLASWLLADSPRMAEHFDRSIGQMVERDRNHASVVAWGLLNETFDGALFRHAVDTLPLVRDLDPTRLVLLSSGRWDGQPAIGSAANPGSRTWEHVWGAEEPDATSVVAPRPWDRARLGYLSSAGDVHLYPYAPFDASVIDLVRTMGAASRPVFLSEYGVGSLFDAIREHRGFEQHEAWEQAPDARYIQSMADRFTTDWHRYRLDDVYPVPEDFLRASYEHMARQRAKDFDAIRSNPQIAGYNLTGMLDHALSGEGLWTFWRNWKPGIMDVVAGGWSSLRWSLFVSPGQPVAGGQVRLEAVLANDGVLDLGDYPAAFRLWGPDGLAWEQRTTVTIAADRTGRPGLATPVLDEIVRLPPGPGRYTLAATLERGGDAVADRRGFDAFEVRAAVRPDLQVSTWGLPANAVSFLREHGVADMPLDGDGQPGRIILIGDPGRDAGPGEAVGPTGSDDAEVAARVDDKRRWERVAAAVRAGATAAIIGPGAFWEADGIRALPIAPDLRVRWFHDWLYHKEGVARRHPLFDAFPAGLLDWDTYGQTIPDHLLEADRPGEIAAAAFAVGSPVRGGYASGILAGVFPEGDGRIVVSLFRLLDLVGSHPVADQLLLNLVSVAAEGSTADERPSPARRSPQVEPRTRWLP